MTSEQLRYQKFCINDVHIISIQMFADILISWNKFSSQSCESWVFGIFQDHERKSATQIAVVSDWIYIELSSHSLEPSLMAYM